VTRGWNPRECVAAHPREDAEGEETAREAVEQWLHGRGPAAPG